MSHLHPKRITIECNYSESFLDVCSISMHITQVSSSIQSKHFVGFAPTVAIILRWSIPLRPASLGFHGHSGEVRLSAVEETNGEIHVRASTVYLRSDLCHKNVHFLFAPSETPSKVA